MDPGKTATTTVTSKAASTPSASGEYAGFARRLGALIIDGIIIQIVNFVLGFVVGLAVGFGGAVGGGESNGSSPVSFAVSILLLLLQLGIALGYYIYFIGAKGQTLGKMALGIKVVTVDGQQVPGYVKAFLREFVGKFLSGIVIGLGYLWMLWDKKKQTWHDKIAGTVVIRVK